jgi:23S rRNA (guanosine2251-2'-O)-methyltransferase
MRPKNPGRPQRPGLPKNRGKAGKISAPTFTARPERQERPPTGHQSRSAGGIWLYGLHAVEAALANPRRKLGRAVLTPRATETLGSKLLGRVRVETADPGAIDRLLPPGAVHQGAALEAWPLKSRPLEEILAEPSEGRRIILVLDQLSDPHNVGAILRTAAAFGVSAVVVQDRHAPPQSGALAKAASGALDLIPYVEVVNIARALDELAELGFWRIALVGDGDQSLAEAVPPGDVALVLGSEGSGIRRLVREHCEASAFIPISKTMESLNVSNAAAISLYELRR